MYRLFMLIAACLSCAACDTPSLYETKLAALPELQQEEGKLRLKECDRLEETIASSQDFSVGGRGAGFGFQLRSAEFKNSSAKDQYLLSLLHTVKVCREWAVFEASQEEFDNAFLHGGCGREQFRCPSRVDRRKDQRPDRRLPIE